MYQVPDVSIYVALITAGAGALGASIPHITDFARDTRQADRAQHERRTEKRQQACLDLLHAANDLRTKVANATVYHGDEMSSRLAEIRSCAADVQLHAVSVGLLSLEVLAEPAEQLAAAARDLAAAAVRNTDMSLNQMIASPDFTTFDGIVDTFRLRAVRAAGE